MSFTAMTIDAGLLLIISLAMLIILSEDEWFQPMLPRLFGIAIGVAAFSQAMWLLGVWIPGASGFPLPRIGFDATVAGTAVVRAYQVARIGTLLRRRERVERELVRMR